MPNSKKAKFVTGNIFNHIVVMSSTNAIGLTALFLVDLADLFFISLLGETELAAAVGYAGTIAFFTTSISIGLSIAMSALVSRAIGQQNREKARRLVINILVSGFIVSAFVAALAWIFTPEMISMLGAKGSTHQFAVEYLRILLPSLPILAVAMGAGAALRSVGDAKRAMYSTLAGGATNAMLDPLFIFVFDWGLHGAAVASVLARFAVAWVAIYGVVHIHQLLGRFNYRAWIDDQKEIFNVAIPAMTTNVATPLGNAYVTMMIASFGDGYVAGWAVVGRLIPVAFAMIFAMSGAVGPIIGQNYGANLHDRVNHTMTRALQFTSCYVAIMAVIIYLLQAHIMQIFGLQGDAAELLQFYCTWLCITFIFNGILFISNAAFNNLGYPTTSTAMNIGKATIGTIPLVYFGAQWFGAIGVVAGQALGSVLFGIIAWAWAQRILKKMHHTKDCEINKEEPPLTPALPLTPFCSSRAYMCAENDEPLVEQDYQKDKDITDKNLQP
ncbi:MATE family efflux transporter [Psychromonas sp. psych-6C06]|uniref:MATE family efflux transporter n=1 Tax=Psychromonas sp. psych-6C06 TaxID=2058089 RepID=UPI000C339124|nr:MATE family efflux transporter [Psychromonas sp. psych-6C06]PKF61684.1 MATE family efflux transporter [Psychromonas sp. psych-6C06]